MPRPTGELAPVQLAALTVRAASAAISASATTSAWWEIIARRPRAGLRRSWHPCGWRRVAGRQAEAPDHPGRPCTTEGNRFPPRGPIIIDVAQDARGEGLLHGVQHACRDRVQHRPRSGSRSRRVSSQTSPAHRRTGAPAPGSEVPAPAGHRAIPPRRARMPRCRQARRRSARRRRARGHDQAAVGMAGDDGRSVLEFQHMTQPGDIIRQRRQGKLGCRDAVAVGLQALDDGAPAGAVRPRRRERERCSAERASHFDPIDIRCSFLVAFILESPPQWPWWSACRGRGGWLIGLWRRRGPWPETVAAREPRAGLPERRRAAVGQAALRSWWLTTSMLLPSGSSTYAA